MRTSRRCSTGLSSHFLARRRPDGVGGEQDPVAAPPGGLAGARDQTLVDEAVDGPIGQRSAQRPDPAELAVGASIVPSAQPWDTFCVISARHTHSANGSRIGTPPDVAARAESRPAVAVTATTPA